MLEPREAKIHSFTSRVRCVPSALHVVCVLNIEELKTGGNNYPFQQISGFICRLTPPQNQNPSVAARQIKPIENTLEP
ncbi:hypothetical protein EG68_04671 [Paragonimus skrjabini miyazakii]|uniref:Uncharacterized protein n=1 Tax=Paragonimus skrjabini miyazakii TaxID=59628 RepID=A0A8S9YY11_9TREM|nr:hypothetical protein EG68_04671 [Paragonimus skrjabini miyazakii]